MKYFKNVETPTMSELVNWFMINFTELCEDMQNSTHSVNTNEPNPYHTGDDQIWTHTMMVCMRAEMENSNKITLVSALLHDIGKPLSKEIIPFEDEKPVTSESNENRKIKISCEVPNSGLKCHFRGHEGISFYKAVSIVNALEKEGVLDKKDKQDILTIISLHGTLFNSIDGDGKAVNPKKVFSKFKRVGLFRNFVQHVKNDSTGRFFLSKNDKKNHAFKLGEDIFTGNQFLEYHNKRRDKKINDKPMITVLVGPPCAGKSTWREHNITDEIVISRDDILVDYGKNKFGENATYSEIWKQLTELNLQIEIDNYVQMFYEDAIKQRRNIIIDMTNVSKKSRNKWLSNLPKGYCKKAIIFATSFDEIEKRNKSRGKKEGKNIPQSVIENMMKGFILPMYNEIDVMEWEFE